ncbi:MAG: hypothetical protein GX363_03870 [Clostridiales bacterium]|nr:hypothetical protein [Clostridiales bacterium]
MDINEKMLLELARQLGFDDSTDTIVTKAASITAGYRDRDEEEILDDILRLKQKLKSNPEQYRKQLRAVRSLRSMMNREQQKRLDRVIDILERD